MSYVIELIYLFFNIMYLKKISVTRNNFLFEKYKVT